jgi:hypothetical protein
MADDDVVEVGIYIHLDNIESARSDANDLAWEHSMAGVHMTSIELGGPEHGQLYQELSRRYEHAVEHLLFFMQNSLNLLQALLDTGHIKLNTDNGPWTDEQASANLGHLAQMICSSYLWLAAGYEIMWPTNEELGNEIGVRFAFKSNEVIDIPEEDQ